MRTELNFKDKTSAECNILGSIEVSGKRYGVFLDTLTRDIYIYGYKKMRGNRYKLRQIKDKKEFREICTELNALVREDINEQGQH